MSPIQLLCLERNAERRERRREASGALGVVALLVAGIILGCAILFGGCTTYKGGSYHDGLVIQAGARIPVAENIQLTVLNFVSGTVFLFDANAQAEITTTQTNTVEFCGLYKSTTVKGADVKLYPIEPATNGCQCASGGGL